MPKFNLDLNLEDAETAEGYEAWAGPLPPTGSYDGKLKIVQLGKASESAKNPGAPMLKVGVELVNTPDKKYDGFVAFRNLVLIESTRPFVNQFLRSLTDGSDAELTKLQKGFRGMVVDEEQKNVLKIGTLKINSPEGQLPIKVSIKQRTYTPSGSTEARQVAGVESFLLNDGGGKRNGSASAPADEPIAEEDDEVETDLADDDEDIFEDADD